MRNFTLKDRETLIELLKARGIMSEDEADTFTHALLDIRESAIEIYDEHLPRLRTQPKPTQVTSTKLFGTFGSLADTSITISKTPSYRTPEVPEV